MSKSLTVYLVSGQTLRFDGVENVSINYPAPMSVSFTYTSRERDVPVSAVFYLEQIAGWSLDK